MAPAAPAQQELGPLPPQPQSPPPPGDGQLPPLAEVSPPRRLFRPAPGLTLPWEMRTVLADLLCCCDVMRVRGCKKQRQVSRGTKEMDQPPLWALPVVYLVGRTMRATRSRTE